MVVSNENQILFPMNSVLSIFRANGGGGDAQITEKHEHSELYILLFYKHRQLILTMMALTVYLYTLFYQIICNFCLFLRCFLMPV
jgi:hypothetical protein